MKKLIILFVCFAVCKIASGQVLSQQVTRFDFFEFSMGIGAPVIDNKSFDNWSETNYHSKIQHAVEGPISFYFIGKDYDGGFQAIYSSTIYETLTLYLGRRVTSPNSSITSFLNIGIGGFADDIYNYAPVGYVLTPDQVGQRMYMQYTGGFLSLQSRNYINNLGFNVSRNRRVNFKAGFYVNLNYRPWGASWQYGYDKKKQETEYDDDGNPYTQTNVRYTSNKVESVPALADKFMDAGVFVAITLSTVRKHGYYSR